MGKGNRNRQINLQKEAEDRYNHPEKYQKKGKKNARKNGAQLPAWASVLAIVLVAVMLLGSISLIVIYENGVIFRAQTAIESDHYKVTGTMMQYYYYYQYQQTYTNYYNMAVSYLGSADYISYFGWNLKTNFAHDDELNNACKLGEAKKDENGKDMKDKDGNIIYDSVAINLRGGTIYTWWDYFMDLAIEQAQEALIFCEAAYAAGYTTLDSLNPDAQDEIDEVFDTLKESASASGYTLNGYLTQLYGNGVSKKDIRKALELSYIASEYTQLIEDKFSDAITDEDVNKKYEDDKYSYHYADVLTAVFKLHYDDLLEEYVSDLGENYKTEDYNKAVDEADREYKLRLAHLMEIAPKFKDAEGNETAYRSLVAEIYAYMYYFDAYVEKTDKDLVLEDVIAESLAFLSTMNDETKVEKTDPLHKRIASLVYKDMDLLLFENMSYSSDSKLNEWAFKGVGQKEGNVLVTINPVDGEETATYYPEIEFVDLEEEDKKEESDDDHDHDEEESDKDSDKDDDKKDDKDDGKKKSEYEGQEYELGAYYMITPGVRHEYKAVDLGYILIKFENHDHKEGEEVDHDHIDAEKVANDYLAELLAKSDLNEDAFEKFAADHTDTIYTYGVWEDCLKGDFGYDEVDEWVFGETSCIGKGGVVEIYGDNTDPLYCAVLYGFGEGKEAWYTEVKEDVLSEKYDFWEAETTKAYEDKISINKTTLGKIGS